MSSDTSRVNPDDVMVGLSTISDKIRALARSRYTRTEIAKLLGIRYQHVRKVLVDAGITDGLVRQVEAERSAIVVDAPAEMAREETSAEVLTKAGFQQAGRWTRGADGAIKIEGEIPARPGVYVLVLDGVVVYVGLTLSGLNTRMDQYRRGHKGQKTSARINGLICASVDEGRDLRILVASPDPLEWNGLPVNAAAGLEAGLIELVTPRWNIRGAG